MKNIIYILFLTLFLNAKSYMVGNINLNLPDSIKCTNLKDKLLCSYEDLFFQLKNENIDENRFENFNIDKNTTVKCFKQSIVFKCLFKINGNNLIYINDMQENNNLEKNEKFILKTLNTYTENNFFSGIKESIKIKPLKNKTQNKKNCKKLTYADIADFKKAFSINLDSDNQKEVVGVKKILQNNSDNLYSLIVVDDDGCILWQSSENIDENNKFIFGEWDYGISLPQFVGDIDGDNKIELIAPAPMSDLSPTYFKIYKWENNKFKYIDSKILVLNKKNNSLQWVSKVNYKNNFWVGDILERVNITKARVELTGEVNGDFKAIEAIIEFNKNGAKVIKWLDEFNFSKNDLIEYVAKISKKDHFNKNGIKLNKINLILHQDRANFYSGLKDKEDEKDSYFNSLKNRKKLDKIKIIAKNIGINKLKKIILNNTPILKISVDLDKNIAYIELLKN
jgi:hypothetical protein